MFSTLSKFRQPTDPTPPLFIDASIPLTHESVISNPSPTHPSSPTSSGPDHLEQTDIPELILSSPTSPTPVLLSTDDPDTSDSS